MNSIEIEVCLETTADATAVEAAGATRIEINSSLDRDGLTPSLEACRWLKRNCQLPIIAMLRNHHQDFYVDSATQKQLMRDGERLLAAGVDGIAYGAVDADGQLNCSYFRELAALCGERPLVCHRVFDTLPDQLRALEQLIDCGVRRVLTSGGAATAEQGIAQLEKLVDSARGRIEILPGSGINAKNAQKFLEIGCRQLHGTFRSLHVEEAGSIRTNLAELRAVCTAVRGFTDG